MTLRKALWSAGLRYRLKTGNLLPGHPDLVFPGAKVAVFVDGCFWHGCPLHGHTPKSRAEYWGPKIDRNRKRDADTDARLTELGWRVVRLWEHDVARDAGQCVRRVCEALAEHGSR